MKCPNCGHKLHMMELAWQERIFWTCLITIAMNQSAQFYDWVENWIIFLHR
jgi:hypothetical protein